MSKYFFRVFINNSYITYINDELTIGSKLMVDIPIKEMYFIKIVESKIYSNLINEEIKLNKVYEINILNIAIMIGIKQQLRHYYLKTTSINKLLILDCKIKYIDKQLIFDTPIYVNYNKLLNGSIYVVGDITLCINGSEFNICNECIYSNEIIAMDFNLCTVFKAKLHYNYYDNNLNRSEFIYEHKFKQFSDKLINHLIPTFIMVVITVITSFLFDRQNMIIFLVISSISTTIIAITNYVIKYLNNKSYNIYLNKQFNIKLNKFIDEYNLQIQYLNNKVQFQLIKQKQFSIGYIKSSANIDKYKISEEVFLNKFKNKCNSLNQELKIIPINQSNFKLVINGKYAIEYAINLLLLLINNKLISRIIIVGNMPNYLNWLNDYFDIIYALNGTHILIDDKNTLIIINDACLAKSVLKSNDLLLSNKNITIFYINHLVSEANYVVSVNDLNYITLNLCDFEFRNEVVYVKTIVDKVVLEIMVRQLINNFVNELDKNELGFKLGNNVFLNINNHCAHGIVVGMTGSGKSVFLENLIYQIATNYSVDKAVIAIVDFKGESLIKKVMGLPHVISTYSNLDDTNYGRIIDAIEIEINKRQQILKEYELSSYDEENNLFPRLFLFIDEFAEIRDASELIITKLIKIARIGRSLGINLILSTQKVSGVVDANLLSNLSYFVCLKVNSKSDSYDILNDNMAYYFTRQGEAALLLNGRISRFVGNNMDDYVMGDVEVLDECLNFSSRNKITHSEYYMGELNRQYRKSKYKIWNTLFEGIDSKYMYVDLITKNEVYDFEFDHYFIYGIKGSGKSSLVSSILSNIKVVSNYIGSNKLFVNLCDNYIDDISLVEVLISYSINLEINMFVVIDNFEQYESEFLSQFIIDVLNNKYKYIKVIIVTSVLSYSCNRFVKHIAKKFIFSVEDKMDYFNIFYQKTSLSPNNFVGRGITLYENNLVLFQNGLNLVNSSKEFNIKKLNGLYYLKSFMLVNLSNSIIVYDLVIPSNGVQYKNGVVGCDLPILVHYSEFNLVDIDLVKSCQLFSMTSKFVYQYQVVNVKYQMYDCKRLEDIILIELLDIK